MCSHTCKQEVYLVAVAAATRPEQCEIGKGGKATGGKRARAWQGSRGPAQAAQQRKRCAAAFARRAMPTTNWLTECKC